jgi:hypothetical protein
MRTRPYVPRRIEVRDVILRLLLICHTERVLDCKHFSFTPPVESLTLHLGARLPYLRTVTSHHDHSFFSPWAAMLSASYR